jgi:hypothetical protein
MAGTAAALVGTAATAATAAAPAAAATAGLIGFGGSVSGLGVLSLASAGLGIASTISGMRSQSAQMRQASVDAKGAARDAELRGLQESNRIKKALLRDISAATARAGAGGIGGSLLEQQVQGMGSEAADELSVSRYNTEVERRRQLQQAKIYKSAGKMRALSYLEPVAGAAMTIGSRYAER